MQGFRRSPPPIAPSCVAGRLRLSALLIALALGACSSAPLRLPAGRSPPAAPPASGGYYLNDGPGANAPPNLDAVPDAVPRLEPLRPAANRPYSVLGREYVPATTLKPYHEIGMASWYGRKYHGQRTSTGEIYDMYAMTAAHPTLALPSYARVTNVATGTSVVVRLNDRGPFLQDASSTSPTPPRTSSALRGPAAAKSRSTRSSRGRSPARPRSPLGRR